MALPSFSEHPSAVGESYTEHMHTAAWFGWQMLTGAFACFVHALLPFLFTKTGSARIALLHERMVTNRVKAQNQGMAKQAA